MRVMMLLMVVFLFSLQVQDRQPLFAEGDITEINNLNTESPIDAEEIYQKAKDCEAKHAAFERNQCFKTILDNFNKGNENLTEIAIRRCGLDGNWLDRNNKSSSFGWTDFIKCFPPYIQDLLKNVSKSSDGFTSKFRIAAWVRYVEFGGLSLSTVSLIVALVIFNSYRALINNRTKVHRHFISVMLAQSVTILYIYVDQESIRYLPRYNIACIILYSCYEFFTSISFAFMLIEGLSLYRTISSYALRAQIPYNLLVISGYSYPIINTLIWFAVANYKYGWTASSGCWYGYNLDSIYWILQGPRLVVLSLNSLFMLCVLKVLIQKMAQRDISETQRIKKTLRATFFLMPLLGITNFISMTNAPVKDSPIAFGVWAFFAYFLRSLQGFFVSFLYCFRNNEVLEVLCRRRPGVVNDQTEYSVRYRANTTEEIEAIPREEETTRFEPPELEDDEEVDISLERVAVVAVETYRIHTIDEVIMECEELEEIEAADD